MSGVSVVIPWRPGCPHRQAALEWVLRSYRDRHPDWQIVVGAAPPGPWCKATAVAAAVARADGDVLVVADADVWCRDAADAVAAVQRGRAAWAIPHRLVHRLTPDATATVLGGRWDLDDAINRPGLSHLAERPYVGIPGGGLVVLPRSLWEDVPLDPRFRGWGGEDHAWGYALACLHGRPWRGRAPLWHLWHPPQPRLTRQIGSLESDGLRRRYAGARLDSAQMRALIEEGKRACRPASSSTTAP